MDNQNNEGGEFKRTNTADPYKKYLSQDAAPEAGPEPQAPKPQPTVPPTPQRQPTVPPTAPRPSAAAQQSAPKVAAQPKAPQPKPAAPRGAAPEPPKKPADNRKMLIIIIAILAALILGLGAWFVIDSTSKQRQIDEAIALKEQAELDVSQRELQNAYDELNSEFAEFENQRKLIMDDSVKRELTMKYEEARMQVEKLQQELRNQRSLSNAEIQRLKGEIETLRNLLRHYVEEINRLNLENEALRNENAEISARNEQLTSRVEETSRRNEELSERMTLAEKLNVTGVNLMALNKKGKIEKKVSKAKQLRVTFTIPQNNSTPVGAKTIYLRITTPSGQLLMGGGKFTFEGSSLDCTAKQVIEYTGEELAGVTMYWDVNTALTAGQYTVELFADNFRLVSRTFQLN